MDNIILCKLLAQRIPPEQFQVQSNKVVFFDPEQNNRPVGSPNESPYSTPENIAIVDGVIKNYDVLAAEYILQKEKTDTKEAEIKVKEAEILRRLAIAEIESQQELFVA